MNFVLPTKAQVGVLSAEIAGEGQRVIMSDGEIVNWTPPPAKPVMPDWSGIKSIAKYFNRTGYSPWPAWLYHPTEDPRLVKNADEGAELGVCYREATADERARYGHKAVWDWQDDSDWRPQPWEGTQKFNPQKPEHGKTVIFGAPNPVHAQNDLVRMLIPEVAAAVAQALKGSAPGAPPNINPVDWEEYQKFLVFKKTSEGVNALAGAMDDPLVGKNGLTEDQQRSLYIEELEERGVKVDKRWSLERIMQEVEKAA